jgi:hypothetical protein
MACNVRKMELPEIEIATYLAYKEGWNPGLNDGLVFYNTDENGFFLAEIDGRVVGCISAVNYNNEFGFIGFYIVDSEFRGSSAGTMLGIAALKYLNGINTGLDGILSRVDNYRGLGFKLAYKNIRYEGIGGSYKYSNNIVPAHIIDIDEICDYDRHCFPVRREAFLKGWLSMIKSHSLVYYAENSIKGYGTIRSCRKGFKIGPIFADDFKIADELYRALSSKAADELVYLDVPEVNQFAVDLAMKYEMKKVFETARMYSIEEPLMDVNKIFGITSFELG